MNRYGKGWYNESYRHALASKGIKTARYTARKRDTIDLGEIESNVNRLSEAIKKDDARQKSAESGGVRIILEGKEPLFDIERRGLAKAGAGLKSAGQATAREFGKYGQEFSQGLENRGEELAMAEAATKQFIREIPARTQQLQLDLEIARLKARAERERRDQERLQQELKAAYEGREPTGQFRPVGLEEVTYPKKTEKELEQEAQRIAVLRQGAESQLQKGLEQAATEAALRRLRVAEASGSFVAVPKSTGKSDLPDETVMREMLRRSGSGQLKAEDIALMKSTAPEFSAELNRQMRLQAANLRSFNPIEERRLRNLKVMTGRRL